MPVTKPLQMLGEAGATVVRKARQGATARHSALNAALGMDNFSRLLKNDSQTAQAQAKSQNINAAQNITGKQAYSGAYPASGASGAAQMFMGGPDMRINSLVDAKNLQEMTRAQKVMQQSKNPLQLVNSLNSLQSARPDWQEAALLSLRTDSHKAKVETASEKTGEKSEVSADVNKNIGAISARFESGKNDIAAIGYDRMGGTSYGKYQISSKTGTMDRFISFLTEKAADIAERLKKTGPANTGNKDGQMPKVWKDLAKEEPERFAALQQEFISKTHFEPAMDKIKQLTGLDAGKLSEGVREAIFSTAVQHGAGGAGRIISRALDAVGLGRLTSGNIQEAKQAEHELVRNIYQNRSGQFASSENRVRNAVQGRLKTEMNMVLDLLQGTSKNQML